MTTPLGDKIRELIALNGPMSVAAYMAICLTDSQHGYYVTRDPLGAGGDFTTAPEVSQMFGEIVGAWLAHLWQLCGSPRAARLIELGPGRGSLMADILRVGRRVPGFADSVSVHMVEVSPALRSAQERMLAGSGAPVSWHADVAEVPEGPSLIVANEFFDALPVRQYVMASGVWRERVVGLSDDGTLGFGIGAGVLPDGPVAPDGSLFEVSPARLASMAQALARLRQAPGGMVVIDYGPSEFGTGDTLQAVKEHDFADPLESPGEADLTSHVDFASLAKLARNAGMNVHGPMPQREFLARLGIRERAARLAAGKSDADADAIRSQLHRLTAPAEMGTLFKVLAVTSPSLRPPPFDS